MIRIPSRALSIVISIQFALNTGFGIYLQEYISPPLTKPVCVCVYVPHPSLSRYPSQPSNIPENVRHLRDGEAREPDVGCGQLSIVAHPRPHRFARVCRSCGPPDVHPAVRNDISRCRHHVSRNEMKNNVTLYITRRKYSDQYLRCELDVLESP